VDFAHLFIVADKPDLLLCSRQTADDRGPAGKFDPVTIRVEDHRYPGHVSTRYGWKTFAHALVS
jgi:hypothetical protein